MCGIAGFVTLEPAGPSPDVLRRMTDVQEHRGPDAEGFWEDDCAHLGHRRLSIIDLAAGAQPMSNEDERLWITYNGEIYNHAELRPDLERAGHRYRTRCDTETILHAYEEHGARCVERFRGMFAFAIWDRSERTLFCARDRLGIKPLYYFFDNKTFVFASEIKALLEHPAVSVELERELLAEHLAMGYSSDDRTLFRGVRKLPPGHTLSLDRDGRLSLDEYWDVPAPDAGAARGDEEWIRECRERFELSVEQRLMSDVPLGMFLSGGVDSSSVAAVMKRLTDQPVKTFSVGYAETEYSELSTAADTARRLGTDHREVRVSAGQFFEALPKLIWHEDEPIVWPSSVALHFVSKLAAEDVKVVLTGEGSDELFAGYSRYRRYLQMDRWSKPYNLLPAFVRGAVRSFVGNTRLLGADMRRKIQHTFVGRETSFESMYIENFLGAGEFSANYDSFLAHWNRAADRPTLARLLYVDLKTYLLELLMKQDQMSMSTSIESRVPFLDHSFVEFGASVPDRMKIRGRTGKYIFKKVAEQLVPNEIIYRPKMGFPTPLRRWLREDSDRVCEILRLRGGLLEDVIDGGALERLISDQTSGRRDMTDPIWRLLNLQIWGEVFLKGRRGVQWNEIGAG